MRRAAGPGSHVTAMAEGIKRLHVVIEGSVFLGITKARAAESLAEAGGAALHAAARVMYAARRSLAVTTIEIDHP